MKEQQDIAAKVQGTKTETTARKPSLTYAIKSFKTLIEKCEQEQWLKKEDIEQLKKMQKTMVEKYIGINMF